MNNRFKNIKREMNLFELDIKCGILILLIDIVDIFESIKSFLKKLIDLN
jgi:hypothetical protein